MKKLIVLVMMMLSITASVLATGAGSDIVYVDDSTNIVLSLVNQNPNPANAGEIMTAYMGLENKGSKLAKDVVVEFIPSYPFTLASGEDSIQQIGSIGAYQGVDGESIKIVDFKVKVDKDASAGTYALKFKYYNANQDYVFEKSVNIEIEGEQSAEVIRIDKTILIPGKESTIKFTLSNVGNSPLRNMVFHWENEDDIILPVGSDNTKYISYLDVADSADLEYKVIADTNADAGLYKLNLYLTYDDGSGDEDEINTVAGIYVGGETDFEVVFSDNSGGQMSFSIANTGSNPADSISVVIPEQIGWSVIGSNSAIIGNLNQGDYTVASFTVQQGGGSASSLSANTSRMPPSQNGNIPQNTSDVSSQSSSNKIKVQVVYTDTMGTRRTVEKDVKVSSSSSSSSLSSSTSSSYGMYPGFGQQKQSFVQKYRWYLLGAVVIVISAVVVWERRRRKLDSLSISKRTSDRKEKTLFVKTEKNK